MSTHHHRHARRRLDELVRAGYHTLILSTVTTRRMYTRLLHTVRQRSTMLRAIGDHALLGRAINALVALAREHDRHVAPPETWTGGEDSVYALVQSLAEHLLGHYPVPRCLAMVWLEPASDATREGREWFIAHARGQRFRSIPELPMRMTRKMERLLIRSPHHLNIRAAMRRAELLALGAKPELVEALLSTRLGEDLSEGDFWRDCMHWFVHHWDEIGADKLAAIIEFIDGQRFEDTTIYNRHGVIVEPPPDPEFTLRGRTPRSVFRLMAQREYELALRREGAMTWAASGIVGFAYHEQPRTAADGGRPQAQWQIVELRDSKQLNVEGSRMHHCVGIYARACFRGRTAIWSLRRRSPGSEAFERRCTIEVNLASRQIVQVRAHCNHSPSDYARQLIGRWAKEAGLMVGF